MCIIFYWGLLCIKVIGLMMMRSQQGSGGSERGSFGRVHKLLGYLSKEEDCMKLFSIDEIIKESDYEKLIVLLREVIQSEADNVKLYKEFVLRIDKREKELEARCESFENSSKSSGGKSVIVIEDVEYTKEKLETHIKNLGIIKCNLSYWKDLSDLDIAESVLEKLQVRSSRRMEETFSCVEKDFVLALLTISQKQEELPNESDLDKAIEDTKSEPWLSKECIALASELGVKKIKRNPIRALLCAKEEGSHFRAMALCEHLIDSQYDINDLFFKGVDGTISVYATPYLSPYADKKMYSVKDCLYLCAAAFLAGGLFLAMTSIMTSGVYVKSNTISAEEIEVCHSNPEKCVYDNTAYFTLEKSFSSVLIENVTGHLHELHSYVIGG